MPSIVRQNGHSHFVTTILLPLDLHDKARARGLNISQVTREALLERIETEGPPP